MKQTETKHTQTPWQVKEYRTETIIQATAFNYSGNEIAVINLANEHAQANAEMICRAVNCHQELVEALNIILANSTDIHIVEQTARKALNSL